MHFPPRDSDISMFSMQPDWKTTQTVHGAGILLGTHAKTNGAMIILPVMGDIAWEKSCTVRARGASSPGPGASEEARSARV